jgi:hypothetical protein
MVIVSQLKAKASGSLKGSHVLSSETIRCLSAAVGVRDVQIITLAELQETDDISEGQKWQPAETAAASQATPSQLPPAPQTLSEHAAGSGHGTGGAAPDVAQPATDLPASRVPVMDRGLPPFSQVWPFPIET